MAELNDDGELGVEVTDVDGGTTIVRVAGDVDIGTRGTLIEALTPVLERGPAHTVIFDLAETTFFDSSGLAVLISAAQDGRTVLLRKPSDEVVLVIRATGLSDLLPVGR